MKIKPIKTEEDYTKALERLDVIFDASIGSKAADELEILSILIEKYESIHYPIVLPDPIEAILFRMEQMNYTENDLANLLGVEVSINNVLSKKTKLSLEMIRKLHQYFNIPTEVLIQPY